MGTFAFAPLLETLLSHIGFKYTMFIMAGVMLNISICGIFFKPVPEPNEQRSSSETRKSDTSSCYTVSTVSESVGINEAKRNNSHTGNNANIETHEYKIASKCAESQKKSLQDYLDYTLLCNPGFLCVGVSVMLATLGHSPASVMLPPLAIQHGVDPSRAAFLLSMMGVADIIGRLAIGVLCDLRALRKHRSYLYITSITISGVANIACAVSGQYLHYATYSVVFGLFAGSYNALTPVILADLLGAQRLASSFGLALLFQGVGFLLGPPTAGDKLFL